MKYNIESKNDLSAGATLCVLIPESEIDYKALLTAENDRPPFLVPFHHRIVDENVEIIYEIASFGKLQYFRGSRDPAQYVRLWNDLLNPLLDCSDWFLTPFSFLMEKDFLFFDKSNEKICYLYLPSIVSCADDAILKELALGITSDFPVTDPKLENLVLRAIMQDFKPAAFLQMLKEQTVPETKSAPKKPSVPTAQTGPVLPPERRQPAQRPPEPPQKQQQQAPAPPAPRAQSSMAVPAANQHTGRPTDNDDVIINLQRMGYGMKSDPAPQSPQPPARGKKKKETKEKAPKEKEKQHALFGKKKKETSPDLLLGAAAVPAERPSAPAYAAAERQPEPAARSAETAVQERTAASNQMYVDDSVTQIEDADSPMVQFHRVGDPSLPLRIAVDVPDGGIFTIGRFDASVNRQQSDFEFDKATKAVSRHHAAVVLKNGEYTLVDLGSKAGTFVNGQRLNPNIPCQINGGDRVSFGNGGADYVFEK